MKKSFLTKNYSDVFNAVLYAAKQMDLRVVSKSKTEGQIELKKGGGLLSFGHNISVAVKNTTNNRVSISVNSESAAAIQLIDWGTNEELENELIDIIKKNI